MCGGRPPRNQLWSAHNRLTGGTLAPGHSPSDCLSLHHFPSSYPLGILRTLRWRPAPCSGHQGTGRRGHTIESVLKPCLILEAGFLQGYPTQPCRPSSGSLALRPWHPIPSGLFRGPALLDRASSPKTALPSAGLKAWASAI